jgi:crotonobetainyl-CoA:carnitine CoA-transferase CaiB-like acyl-CoA transferase
MVSGMIDMLSVPLSAARSGTSLWPRREGLLSGHYGCYGLYRCEDSRWVAVGALDNHFWQNLCAELECEELVPLQFAPDPARTEVKRVLAARFLQRTAEEWFALLGAKDCCVTPVRTFPEALANGCFKGEKIGGGLSLSEAPKDSGDLRVPQVGQDSVEILSELGISSGRLQQLQREGVVG